MVTVRWECVFLYVCMCTTLPLSLAQCSLRSSPGSIRSATRSSFTLTRSAHMHWPTTEKRYRACHEAPTHTLLNAKHVLLSFCRKSLTKPANRYVLNSLYHRKRSACLGLFRPVTMSTLSAVGSPYVARRHSGMTSRVRCSARHCALDSHTYLLNLIYTI